MKGSEIATVILVATISFFGAFFIVGWLFGESGSKANVPTLQAVNGDLKDLRVVDFNEKTINPTVEIILNQGNGDQDKDKDED